MVDLTFTGWNFAPQITDATFVPKVPADYEGIAIVQRAAAVKKATAAPAAGPPRRPPRNSEAWSNHESTGSAAES